MRSRCRPHHHPSQVVGRFHALHTRRKLLREQHFLSPKIPRQLASKQAKYWNLDVTCCQRSSAEAKSINTRPAGLSQGRITVGLARPSWYTKSEKWFRGDPCRRGCCSRSPSRATSVIVNNPRFVVVPRFQTLDELPGCTGR